MAVKYPTHLRDFHYWISERHEIWRRRFVLMQEPPWTEDVWLRDFKFTNAFRELDRGTLFFMEEFALPVCADAEKGEHSYKVFLRDYIWVSAAYRLLNRIETFKEVPLPRYSEYPRKRKEFEAGLRRIKDRGDSVMTNAHLTVPCPKGVDKVGGYMMTIDELHSILPAMVKDIIAISKEQKYTPQGAANVHKVIQRPKRLGHFTAYEVYCDLCYVRAIPFEEDTWANAGPGAQKGLKLIFGEEFKSWFAGMLWLRNRLPFMMAMLELPWHPWTQLNRQITLRLIEHSLCEYGKYDRLRNGTGKARMIFKPGVTTFTPEVGHYQYVKKLHRVISRVDMIRVTY